MDAILRLADVPHSVISTRSGPTANEQQQRLQPAQTKVEQRRPRGPTSSPRRRASGNNHLRRPLSSDTHANLRTAVRSATMSSGMLRFSVERAAQTLDRLERTASDFDVRLLAENAEKSMTLPKSGGRRILHRRGISGGKGGNASDGDEIDATPAQLSGKRRRRFWFKNLFRSTDKSSQTKKLQFSRKSASRKMWENCV